MAILVEAPEKSEKITITRALTTIGLLDKRIKKAIEGARFVDIYQNRLNLVLTTSITKEVFTENAKKSMQSITDLIERRKKMKSAILISNAKTMVKIGGIEYAVIEAIERKNSISYEKNLLASMKAQITFMKEKVEKQRPELGASIEDLLKNNLGDGDPTTEEKKSNQAMADTFFDKNVLNILDPCDIGEYIEKLDEEIDTFLAEVDLTLSESNTRTKIEV